MVAEYAADKLVSIVWRAELESKLTLDVRVS